MATKTSWHRYGTKWRHSHPVYRLCDVTLPYVYLLLVPQLSSGQCQCCDPWMIDAALLEFPVYVVTLNRRLPCECRACELGPLLHCVCRYRSCFFRNSDQCMLDGCDNCSAILFDSPLWFLLCSRIGIDIRKHADTIGTVLVPWAGRFQC